MSNISNFTKSQSLLPIITDIFNVFILPPICFIGILLSLLCILITNRIKNNTIFLYIKINAFSDMIFLTINFFIGIIRCGEICPLDTTYAAKFYEIYIYLYIGSTILMISSFTEIFIIIIQYLTIRKINIIEKLNPKIVLFGFLIIALILNSPIFIIRKIDEKVDAQNVSIYSIQLNDFGKTDSGRLTLILYGLVRGAFLFIILFICNILLTFEYRKYLNKKKKIQHTTKTQVTNSINKSFSKTENNSDGTTKSTSKIEHLNSRMSSMLISMSVYFLISHLPFSVAPILFALNVNSTFYNGFLILANFVLFMSHGFTFFVFFLFNSKIRQQTFLFFKRK